MNGVGDSHYFVVVESFSSLSFDLQVRDYLFLLFSWVWLALQVEILLLLPSVELDL